MHKQQPPTTRAIHTRQNSRHDQRLHHHSTCTTRLAHSLLLHRLTGSAHELAFYRHQLRLLDSERRISEIQHIQSHEDCGGSTYVVGECVEFQICAVQDGEGEDGGDKKQACGETR